MKVLLISHSYMPKQNHKKLDEIASFDDVELWLLKPTHWKHVLKEYTLEKKHAEKYKIIPKMTVFNGSPLYLYISLSKSICEIKPDIIHVEEEPWTLSAFQAVLEGKISGSKTIFFTWENTYVNHAFPCSFFEKYVLDRSDHAIAGNQESKDVLIQKGFEKPIEVLPQLGIDTELFKKSDSSQLSNELRLKGFVIGFIGRLVEEKGILTLVMAVSKLKNFTLLLVGRGPLKSTILDLAWKYGIEKRLVFVDTVPHYEVPRYLNCMDVLVLPSLTTTYWKEQFGHVLIEAMSCEVPVIGSDSGEIPNTMGDSGLIFKEGLVEQLSEKLLSLISDEKYREELGRKGRRRVLENYSWRKIAEGTYKIYKRCELT